MTNLKIKNFQQKIDLSATENKVLEYWDQTKAFEKSIANRPKNKPYVFYDGPPFATGTPHYGHILVSTVKDLIPRYWTMKGYRVKRVWGWDCHGIPIENIVETQLGFKGGKKDIEEFGIHKFNDACRAAIWKFDKEWERVIRRIGRWVDFKNSYKTMDLGYMESVWWAFKTLHEKGFVYQGKKVILYCPRCSTPLSNFEIAMDNSYTKITEPSTTYKYKLQDQDNVFLLAWSTTPWNKLATPALAVNPNLTYVKVKQDDQYYILAKSTLQSLKNTKYKIVDTFLGKDLDGLHFEPHYDFYPERQGKEAFMVVADDFVTAQEGTGVVTLAIYGEDDFRIIQARNIQQIEHVDTNGRLKPEITPWGGKTILAVNPLVNEDLKSRGLIYKETPHTHNVAVCYRCNTRLYHSPVPAWFIDVQKLKTQLIDKNQSINWYPNHLKHGRFGKGLKTAPDWNISRSRYWGTPMPIWVGKSGKTRIIGSMEDLQTWAVDHQKASKLIDIHREFVDDLEVWVDDKKTEKGHRIPEVFDCWVESGSMPYASVHYPFENKAKFEHTYPAQFIVEYIAQTRAWFYTLHVMSVATFDQPAFENALTTGNILAQDGSKMSKSKNNYPDPEPFIEKYGVDALRFYLVASPVMRGDNLNFQESGVKEIYQKLINMVWNVFSFHKLYSNSKVPLEQPQPEDILDRWLISRTNSLTKTVTKALDDYDTPKACREIQNFASQLSTWYLRRSRQRIRDEKPTQAVFAWVINHLAHLMAPITPFISEVIYQNLHKNTESIHLNDWPTWTQESIDQDLEEKMNLARKIVESIHSLRQQSNIKVRQPLGKWGLDIHSKNLFKLSPEITDIIHDETNVKSFQQKLDKSSNQISTKFMYKLDKSQNHEVVISIDTTITPQLKQEGDAREIVRQVQLERKKQKIDINDKIDLKLPNWPDEFADYIKSKTLSKTLTKASKISLKSAK